MKTKTLYVFGAMIVLMGMATPVTSFAQSVAPKQLQSMIDSQCMREIRESKVWRNALAFQDLPEQAKMKKTACECVYQDVSQDSEIKKLFNGADYDEIRGHDLISKAVLKGLRTCTQKVLN